MTEGFCKGEGGSKVLNSRENWTVCRHLGGGGRRFSVEFSRELSGLWHAFCWINGCNQ